MKYAYAYKTSDGTRHEATLEAKSRDEAFAALRARGIRPIKVVAADGAKANGEVRGVRKRVVTAIALGAAVVAGIAAFMAGESSRKPPSVRQSAPRHQIYGDPAIWDEIERNEFAAVFPDGGDRYLALYAIPGRHVADRYGDDELCKMLQENLDKDIRIAEDDDREVAELKRIVQGMKEELRWYLADGVGTVLSYVKRLRERQDEEIRIYELTRREMEQVTDQGERDRRNATLRALGLRTIPRPRKQ